MFKYPKIQGLYKRYREGDNKGKFIIGKYSLPEFELLKDIEWEWTEKIDGTNIRAIWNGLEEKLEFKGRTDKAEMPTHLLKKLQQLFTVEKLKRVFGKDHNDNFPMICLYGEGYGYKIQSGGKYFPENPKEVGFILFDIKVGNFWLKREDIINIANELNIKYVPHVGYGTIDEAIKLVKNGYISKFGDFIAEGLVIKPKIELRDRRGHRIITKIKTKDFKENTYNKKEENWDEAIKKSLALKAFAGNRILTDTTKRLILRNREKIERLYKDGKFQINLANINGIIDIKDIEKDFKENN